MSAVPIRSSNSIGCQATLDRPTDYFKTTFTIFILSSGVARLDKWGEGSYSYIRVHRPQKLMISKEIKLKTFKMADTRFGV